MPGEIEGHRPMTLISRNGSRRDETEPRQVALYPHRRQAGRQRAAFQSSARSAEIGPERGAGALTAELSGKIVDLIREGVPSVNRVAALANGPAPFSKSFLTQIQLAGEVTRTAIDPILIHSAEELDAAFPAMEKLRPDAVIVQPSRLNASPSWRSATEYRPFGARVPTTLVWWPMSARKPKCTAKEKHGNC